MSLTFFDPSGGVGTSFPSSPNDKDEFTYVADGTNGVYWRFKYRSATTKWIFIGGAPLFSQVLTSEAVDSGTYTALATPGPSITLPFAGDYDVSIGVHVSPAIYGTGYMSYDIGGTGAVDADNVQVYGNAYAYPSLARTQRKTGLTAVALTAKYKTAAGSCSFAKRWMAVTPVQK